MSEPTISVSQPSINEAWERFAAKRGWKSAKLGINRKQFAQFYAYEVCAERDRGLQQATADRKAWLDAINTELAQLRDWANREQKRAELAKGELQQANSEWKKILDGACLCEFCAAKFEAMAGEKHRQREVDRIEAQLQQLTDLSMELQQAREERNQAVADLTAISGGDGFRCGLIYGIEKPFVGGCGEHVSFADSYRCADCMASFHRDCINQHFELDAYVKTLREQHANGAIDDWKQSVANAEKRAESAEKSLSEAREELARLKAAINRYGIHEVIDGVSVCEWYDAKKCTCGFSEFEAIPEKPDKK